MSIHRTVNNGSIWTDEENKKLLQLIAKGLSARDISAQIPGKSRCAVLGRLKRIRDKKA